MRFVSIETTPNPNSMKLNFDRPVGKSITYTQAEREGCPTELSGILDVAGVKSLYVCHDFITVNRDPRADWKPILDSVTKLLTGQERPDLDEQRSAAERLGQVAVTVQTFRGIPVQVKIVDSSGEKRIALESRFAEAAQVVQDRTGADYLKERYWADWGARYGSLDEIATEVADEIQGTINNEDLDRLIALAMDSSAKAPAPRPLDSLKADLASDDWHRRLQAVQELGTGEESIPILVASLKDDSHQVRRLAAAALGASGSAAAVAPLADALINDPSVGVRRTAGDALSDLGDASAEAAVCRALSDTNKLVRWRAARFLADVGTTEALPFLRKVADDPEFEVRLEIEAATERIAGGKVGSMPAWKKILSSTEARAEAGED